jgi:ABC-type Fe3+/spermidine/putrescine transport system ATPase subunit
MSIRIENLDKRFGAQVVLERISLEVAEGELFVLLGASGSGKSTLLRVVAGLTMPDRGRVLLDGRDVTTLRAQQRGTGFVFQNYSVFRHMSVGQNIEFGLKLRKVPRAERARRRDQLLDLVGLPGFGSRDAAQLSGGQQQRVAIARALAYEPRVLLLDEPFGALDVRIRTQLRRSLREIQERLRITTVLVTHDQDEAFELADRVGLMDRGRLIEVGRAEELYARPRTLFGATFLGSGTLLMGRVEAGRARFRGLGLSVVPDRPHEDGEPAHLLVRPEDLLVSAEAIPGDLPELGKGTVVEESFAGAVRRVRIRFPNRAEVHQASSSRSDSDGFTVEALLTVHEQLPDGQVRVALRRWHFLDPPSASLLVADPGRGSIVALELARALSQALGAKVTVLGVALDASQAGRLGWRIQRRLARAHLASGELRLRYGSSRSIQILNEQSELLSQMIVVSSSSIQLPLIDWAVPGRSLRRAPGRTVLALIANTRVPVLVVAGRPRGIKHALVVSTPHAGATDFLRESARLARPLNLAATLIETGEGRHAARENAEDPFVARGIEVRTRERLSAAESESEATALLQFSSDLVMVPVIQRAPHQTNEIEPLVAELLASADRPVLVLPVERTEADTATQ